MSKWNISDEELEGLECFLTEVQEFIDNFDEEDATSNFAGAQPYPSDGTFGPLMCGKDGYKISKGEPLLDKEEILSLSIFARTEANGFLCYKNSKGKLLNLHSKKIKIPLF